MYKISTSSLEAEMSTWAISDQVQKQRLMLRFLKIHGGLTSNNDFVGFLVSEFGLDKHNANVGTDGA
ncbi:MAG: hypothetical protein KJN87_05630 [Desulfofustis sp.]|nr:hypothetical protein [Desulfofustis sp.]